MYIYYQVNVVWPLADSSAKGTHCHGIGKFLVNLEHLDEIPSQLFLRQYYKFRLPTVLAKLIKN